MVPFHRNETDVCKSGRHSMYVKDFDFSFHDNSSFYLRAREKEKGAREHHKRFFEYTLNEAIYKYSI